MHHPALSEVLATCGSLCSLKMFAMCFESVGSWSTSLMTTDVGVLHSAHVLNVFSQLRGIYYVFFVYVLVERHVGILDHADHITSPEICLSLVGSNAVTWVYYVTTWVGWKYF